MPPPFDLICGYLDGELSPQREEELLEWLGADPGNVRVFVREAHLHSALRDIVAGRMAQLEAESLSPEMIDPQSPRGSLFSMLVASVRRRPFWTFAGATLILGLMIALLGMRSSAPAWVVSSRPGAYLVRDNAQIPVTGRTLLRPGDVVLTEAPSQAAVEFPREHTRLELSEKARMRLSWTNSAKVIQLQYGTCYGSIGPQHFGRSLQFLAPNAVATVLGTDLKLSVFTNRTEVEVYNGRVRLEKRPNSETVLVKSGFSGVVADGQPILSQPIPFNAGSIRREYWLQIPGSGMNTLTNEPRFPSRPDGVDYLTSFETPRSTADNYGARLRGYLRPPRTGEYRFWIAADDIGELWLSPTDEMQTKERICFTSKFTGPHEWAKSADQKSRPFHLIAGRRYYIEALLKEAAGDDGLAIAWQGPGFDRQVIPGEYLSPIPDAKEKQ